MPYINKKTFFETIKNIFIRMDRSGILLSKHFSRKYKKFFLQIYGPLWNTIKKTIKKFSQQLYQKFLRIYKKIFFETIKKIYPQL